jgi:MoaE-MoaD fusion protein
MPLVAWCASNQRRKLRENGEFPADFMHVTLLAFGMLRDHFPAPDAARGISIELDEGATVRDLLDRCEALAGRNSIPWASIAVAVNREYAQAAHVLAEGDEVALLPPVSGGADATPYVRLTHEPIVPGTLIPPLERPEDGAIVVFDGIVRNHSRGRATRYLEYEAYEAMALRQMEDLAAQALARFAIRNVALVHRLGRIEIGEPSVLIAVFSAHRAAAFDACRWIIDTLKQTVPIWKKEFFADGAVWAQGEPFPAELAPTAPAPERAR